MGAERKPQAQGENLRNESAKVLSDLIDQLARYCQNGPTFEQVCFAALRGVQRALGVRRSALYLVEPDGKLRRTTAVGLTDEVCKAVEIYLLTDDTITSDSHPTVIQDIYLDPRLEETRMLFVDQNIRSIAYVPFLYKEKTNGGFLLVSPVSYDFEAEIEFAMTLGKLIAFAADRERTMRGLRESELLFKAAFDAASIGKALVSIPDGRLIKVNTKIANMMRCEPEMLVGKTIFDFTHPDDLAESVRFFDRLIHGQIGPYEIDKRYVRPDGTVFWGNLNVAPIRDIDGKLRQVVSSIQDITERKDSREKLKKANEELESRVQARTQELQRNTNFLSSLVENIPNMIFVKDAKELRFVAFNKAGEEIIGVKSEDMLGKNDYDFFPKSEADFFVAKDRAVLREGKTVDIPEEPIHTRDNGQRILHTKKIPLYDAEGLPEYLVGISEDITERKQAEAIREKLISEQEARREAEKAIQIRDDFLSIASHELKTPLTPVRMYLQLARKYLDELPSTVPKIEFLKKAIANTNLEFERFLKLVDNLLDVSRIRAGRLVLEPAEMDLNELARTIVARFGEEFKRAGTQLDLSLDGKTVGMWDPGRIEQVIINLLTNAMKYGGGQTIHISVERDDSTAYLRVRDGGIGIAKDNYEKIFERFERVAPIKNYSGFGLGLFISRQIVRAHGGEIRVESEVGHGSTFTMELPLKRS